MKTLFLQADAVLRGIGKEAGPDAVLSLASVRRLCALIGLFGGLYGAAMGMYGSMEGGRALQVVYSMLKVPLLLLVTFALSLPSFFIFNTLYGLRADFGQALRALLSGQAGLTVLLASLAPLTLLCNVTTPRHETAVLFNALMFGVATAGGQILLRRYYSALVARDARHRLLMRFWGVLYAFVGIQMGWILRPFVGDPDRPVAFFRADSWGNAYISLFQLIRHVFFK